MGLRDTWRRLNGREEVVEERPSDWSRFTYHNTIAPYRDPSSPAGSFYMERFLSSKDRKGRGKIFGVCLEGQSAQGHYVEVYRIGFDVSVYSPVLLEEDYPHIFLSLLEEFSKSKGSYQYIRFAEVTELNKKLLIALGGDVSGKSAGLANDDGWKMKREAFFAVYNECREEVKTKGRKMVGTQEGIAIIDQDLSSLKR